MDILKDFFQQGEQLESIIPIVEFISYLMISLIAIKLQLRERSQDSKNEEKKIKEKAYITSNQILYLEYNLKANIQRLIYEYVYQCTPISDSEKYLVWNSKSTIDQDYINKLLMTMYDFSLKPDHIAELYDSINIINAIDATNDKDKKKVLLKKLINTNEIDSIIENGDGILKKQLTRFWESQQYTLCSHDVAKTLYRLHDFKTKYKNINKFSIKTK